MFNIFKLFGKKITEELNKKEENLPENVAFKEGDLLIEHAPEEEGGK